MYFIVLAAFRGERTRLACRVRRPAERFSCIRASSFGFGNSLFFKRHYAALRGFLGHLELWFGHFHPGILHSAFHTPHFRLGPHVGCSMFSQTRNTPFPAFLAGPPTRRFAGLREMTFRCHAPNLPL